LRLAITVCGALKELKKELKKELLGAVAEHRTLGSNL